MDIEGSKIMRLIEHYGKQKGFEEKHYLRGFTSDLGLNYTQWAAYTRGSQNLGIKVLDQLMQIFPDLNLNWLLKDDPEMFLTDIIGKVAEPEAKYMVTNVKDPVMTKLDAIHEDLKKMAETYKMSHN